MAQVQQQVEQCGCERGNGAFLPCGKHYLAWSTKIAQRKAAARAAALAVASN